VDVITLKLHHTRHEETGADEASPTYHHTRHERGALDQIQGLFNAHINMLMTPRSLDAASALFAYKDIDIAPFTGIDTAKTAIIRSSIEMHVQAPDASNIAWISARYRTNGGAGDPFIDHHVSTNNASNVTVRLYASVKSVRMFFVPVDATQIFEVALVNETALVPNTLVYNLSLIGYIK